MVCPVPRSQIKTLRLQLEDNKDRAIRTPHKGKKLIYIPLIALE